MAYRGNGVEVLSDNQARGKAAEALGRVLSLDESKLTAIVTDVVMAQREAAVRQTWYDNVFGQLIASAL